MYPLFPADDASCPSAVAAVQFVSRVLIAQIVLTVRQGLLLACALHMQAMNDEHTVRIKTL